MQPVVKTRARRFVSLLLGALLFAGPAVALEDAEPNLAEFSEAGKQAFDKLQQDDMAGAIELLEQQRQAGAATHVDLALLGALYLETGRPDVALEALRVVADTETADPAVLFNAGRAALTMGEVEAGAEYLERSVRKLPISPAARELGLLRGAQGRVSEAFRLLRAWVAQNPGDLDARLALVAAGLKIGRAGEMGPLLQGLSPDDPKIGLLRAQFLNQTGDPQSAILVLEGLRRNAPAEMQADVTRLLADSYLDVDRSADAVALLDGKVAGDPRLALLLAEGHRKSGASDVAAATLRPFAEPVLENESLNGPIAYQVALDYGRALASAGRTADALPYLTRAAELEPREPLAWKSLGDALTSLGRSAEAAGALDKFRELSEEGAPRRLSVAEVAAQDPAAKGLLEAQDAMTKGETQRALAVLRQEVALSPDDIRPRLLEVRLLAMLERYEEALRSAEATVERFPDHVDALYQRGVIQMALNAPLAAEQDLRRVLELAPEHVPALNDLAVVMMVQGNKDEAQKLLERLLELSPDNRLALQNLERLRDGG